MNKLKIFSMVMMMEDNVIRHFGFEDDRTIKFFALAEDWVGSKVKFAELKKLYLSYQI